MNTYSYIHKSVLSYVRTYIHTYKPTHIRTYTWSHVINSDTPHSLLNSLCHEPLSPPNDTHILTHAHHSFAGDRRGHLEQFGNINPQPMASEAEKERDRKRWESEQEKAKLQVFFLASPLLSLSHFYPLPPPLSSPLLSSPPRSLFGVIMLVKQNFSTSLPLRLLRIFASEWADAPHNEARR